MKTEEAISNLEYLISGCCTDTQLDYIEEIEMAIDALEKHTPKKPNWQGDEYCLEAHCPNCGEWVDDYENPCEYCTQLIDWSDCDE